MGRIFLHCLIVALVFAVVAFVIFASA